MEKQNKTLKYKAEFHSFLKQRCRLSYKVTDFILITLFILYNASGAPQTGNSLFVVITYLFTVGVFLYRKCRVDNLFYIFLSVWCAINFVSYNINTLDNLGFETFLGWTLRMTMPYFIIKSIGSSFFEKLFNYAYVLVVLSLPLFVLEQLFSPLFSAIAPLFSFMTGLEQVKAGGFYSFVYMFSWGGGLERNCGFMWEPGAYSCMLTFLLYYYWFRNGVKIDKKVSVIVIAIITTFSTAGYLALFFAILLYIIENKRMKKYTIFIPILLVIAVAFGVRFYNESEFMSEKIERYIETGTDTYEWSFEGQSILRVSRLGIFLISLDNAVHRPWGEGIFYSDYIIEKYQRVSGPSSLADILRTWGWLGWIFLISSFIYYGKIFKQSNISILMFSLSMVCVLFSNPFMFKYLVYGLFFYAFLYKNNKQYVNTRIQKVYSYDK